MTEQTPENGGGQEPESLGWEIQKQILFATCVALVIAGVVFGLYNLEINPVIIIVGAVSVVGAGMVVLVQRFGIRSVAVSTLLLWGGFAVAAVVQFGGGNG